jgi:hypothetical protein
MTFGSIVYSLGALVSLACSVLLLRGYVRGRQRLLLWSGICFALLTVSNVAVFVDLVVLPQIDFSLVWLVLTVFALAVMIFGLVWESH